MNKDKIKLTVSIIVAIIIIIVMVVIIRNKNAKKENNANNFEISYNNETQEYYIQDENGDILHSAPSEDELYIYKIDPNYDAKNYENAVEK
jgi:hypothetical protein